jgi:teichuronic acid exporter
MLLKQKAITGLTWSFVDSFANQGIQFAIGIILARLLSPVEFGLVGMIVVFTAISQSFIDSGFSQALIRKPDCSQEDYSTVFYFNVVIGAVCYLALFFLAAPISFFYEEPQLVPLIRVLCITLIISGIGLIQRTILTKRIDFKLQTKISLVSALLSGGIGIAMAMYGWGVWSLVWKTLSLNIFSVVLLWIWTKWRPSLVFNMNSFREMFNFGSKLLASGLLDTAHRNIYYLIIGKYFTATELGYYARADEFSNIPSANLNNIIGRVSYPILSIIQDDNQRLKIGYKKLIKGTMLVTFVLMVGMAAVAEPMVVTLIGEKWLPCVAYIQLLCFASMLYPLHALNLNMLNIKGRSDLFLRLEVIKKFLAVPTIVIGVLFGIKIMIIGMIVNSFLAYFLNSFWSGRLIGYPMKEQVMDIMPSFMISLAMGIIVFLAGHFLSLPKFATLCIQIMIGATITVCIARIIRLDAWEEMVGIMSGMFSKTKPDSVGG